MADGVKLFEESNDAGGEEELTEESVIPGGHLNEVFCYDRVKRTRGRPGKDCQRPAKHHLGQSMATKVFPGRPRFRGRKHLQHFFMTHSTHKLQDVQTALDFYDDIDSDLKSSLEISGKMLISSDAVPDNELKIEKFCALCNLSEKSLLGQGKLEPFKPSESFNCFDEMLKRKNHLEVTSGEGGSELKLFFKKQKIMNRPGECSVRVNRSKSFPEKSSLLNDLIQELELTGFKSMPDAAELFEQSGELHAHFNCAAWSDGVTKTFENRLSNVDKAVVAAAFQKCSKCSRYGASVRCCVSDCSKIYHYPCAIVSGALQNANCFKILCSIHLEDAFSFGVICMACHESGDLSQLLLCTSCSNYYHGNCMDPPILPSSDLRAGWQCLDCKVCQNCRQPVESGKMIICNTCDKAYHTFCIKPAISSVPKSGWKCSACRMCGDCGARTPGNGPSSRWHMNYSVCDSCYQQRNKGIACPLCGKAYRQFSQRKGMKHCTMCQKYIHEECDKRSRRNSMDYVCPLCSCADIKSIEGGEIPIRDNFLTSSRESFLSGNDESFSSDSEDANDAVQCKIVSRRTNDLRQKKSFKPKYKSFSIPNFLYSVSSQKEYKMDDDDPTEDNKLILASAVDEFVLCQDLCVMCGSFGRGEEGRLISCAQCGQCYHSYCVSVKVTNVVLKKGWRCLDCTVCEGCGQPHDEGRLLLCDECDISFHIYCLDPPLQEVPQGNWKCKWCVNCLKCGSKSPGVNCSWQMNYTLCGPCASYGMCCVCLQHYEEKELIIQCSKCERWLHSLCDQIGDEEQAERCAEYGYNCPHCRPPDELPPHLLPVPRTPTPEIEVMPEKHPSPVKTKETTEPSAVKSKHPVQFLVDGVCLSESGMQYIKSLAPDQPKKIPRTRKIKQSLSEDSSTSANVAEEVKSEAVGMSVEELALKAYDFEEGKLVIDSSDDKKKRPRKLQKLGIGGFSVKPRGRYTPGKDFIGDPDGANAFQSYEERSNLELGSQLTDVSELNGDKPKRKRKPKKKTHLDESFPTYLRDAFFGRDLLVSCKKLGKSGEEDPMKEDGLKESDVKASLKEEKDFSAVVGSGKSRDINVTYKSMIKSEIESIKEEHLSDTTPVFSAAKVLNPYSGSSPGTHHSVMHPDSNSSWPDSDCDQTQMQKSLLKWESDEQLGLLSTISPVLYANINLPHLKIEFPAWADRVKQIAKIWRGLPPEKRQPYLQRARENRAASRTQRSSSMECEPKSVVQRVESDQEKQWKQLQAMRQMQQHTQQRLYQEQRQQTVLKSQAEKPPAAENLKLYHSKSLSEIPENKEGRKVFEKRWSSSDLIQIKREPETIQTSFQKSTDVHSPRLQASSESQFSIPMKKIESSVVGQQVHKTPSSVLIGQDEMSKESEVPPALPRPHSSESFFQISASPQSQLNLDSHSQPSPASSKALGALLESPKPPSSEVDRSKIPVGSPKLQPPVEQFVLQSPLTSASLVKQLSQYKETFGSITNAASSTRTLLASDKPIEQQNLEHFLQESLTYPNKQLKDLLQNKKLDENKDGGQAANQGVLTSSEVSSAPPPPPPPPENNDDKNSFSVVEEPLKKQETAGDDGVLPKEESSKEEDSNKKRKTTAADLVKDLETQPEDHDVIVSGCNLDVLPGELELDDDELLGLGNDFNILEYADPELDKSLVGEGDKNNILDEHLDLDDKDEELEDDVIKESDVSQEKDLISQEEKRGGENEKCKEDPRKEPELPDTFLSYDKKDVQTFDSSFDAKNLDTTAKNDHLPSVVKEETKPIFSSCSQTYSPSVEVKLEKVASSEAIPKSHPITFGPENQCPEPPSYRMVTALKQAVVSQQHTKALFPLHINMPQPSADESSKPLLLQEQPLLLAELVEQEKREQRRHTQEGMISPHGDALLSDIDFERLKDDVFSGPPDDSLGVPGSLLGSQDPSMSANFGPPPYSLLWQNQDPSRNVVPRPVAPGFLPNLKKSSVSAVISSLGLQTTTTTLTQKTQIIAGPRPLHPNFVPSPVDDPEKLKLLNYEKQLLHQQAVLSTQQKYFETEVIRLRKIKKALNAKQRQLRKNGSELTENDSLELARVSQEQAGLQKQLDQVRKQSRQNTMALQDYRLKQQKRQQPQPLPLHPPPVNSSPQNSQFASPTSPSVSSSHHPGMFSAQLQLQMMKAENKNWTNQGDPSVSEQMSKKEPLDRNIPPQTFPLHPSQSEVTLKSLVENKKRLSEDIIFKHASNDSSSSMLVPETEEQSSENVSTQMMKEQKEDSVSSVKSPVPQSILSQSLPSSVSNTLKFTLRQTGMPTVCLPTESASENAPQMSYPVSDEKSEEVKSLALQQQVVKKEMPDEDSDKNAIKEENTDDDKSKDNVQVVAPVEVQDTIQIKQEIIEDEVSQSSLQLKQKEGENDGSSDEELVNINNKASSEVEQGEQNVLLKQLLQNCPSADTPRKPDSFSQGLRKEESDELELPFDLESKGGKLIKKPSYLDIRRAQLEKEPTPPPGEKPKNLKRKRVKKKKVEQPEGGVLPKKKCRRASSKNEEGYESYVETVMNKLTSLGPVRILEPNIKPNYSAVSVFGAPDLNCRENQLKGCYGSAVIPNQNDVYSFHPFTKERPPSPTLLPPSSPPYRGFYNQEFKALEKNEMALAIKTSTESEPLKIAREAGSPDTVLSSSSPECCLFEAQSCKWPKLVFVDKILPPERKCNTSPSIPLIYPIPIRLSPREWTELDEEKDKENIPNAKCVLKNKMSGVGGYSAPLKDSGNVAVTLTLSSAAAEDICGVLSALAELLKIPIPASFEIVERTATPPSQKLGLYRRSKNSDVSIHSLLNGKPRFCRHCDIVVLSAGIRKKAVDLSMSKEEQEEEEVIFCSTNCYMQFALTHQATAILEEKEVAAVVDHVGEMYSSAEDSKDPMLEDSLKSEEMEASNHNPYDIDKMDISNEEVPQRKWKSIRYKYWHSDLESLKAKRKEDSNEKAARPFYHTIKPSQTPKDERKCIFCHMTGDGDTNGAARLLNMDVNKWVHLNCGLWSYEVYETVNGALMNVEMAFKRSRHLTCYHCQKPGASVRCFKTRCPNVYHFPCARKEQCAFYKDKTVLCPQHIHKGNPENRLESVAVFRRVYVNREEHKQVASMIQDEKYVMRIGSLLFLNIGQLLPQQIQAFHTTNCIYPVGYKVIRMYWSMRKVGRRSQYICTIDEVCGKPEFTIQVKDLDQKDLILKDKTAKGVWQKVLYPIEKMRKQAKTIKIFPDFITGDDLFGLTEPAVLRIIESLPGVDTLCDYNFRYGRSPFLELPLAINPTGCARSEPKLRTHFKRSHTLHTSNTSRSAFHSAFAGIYPEVSSPYIKQFVHSKSSQYRKMKTEWRNNVYLARSRIQGLGLYAARDMEKHTMVIEYIGQLIRNEIAERNEAIYDAQNRGVYMFRLDENRVIDATLSGGLARYINHSCNPNCVTEVVQIDRENKILIITNRRLTQGEELSYDYKFEVEDDQHKIPCLCGAPNCRKWMN